MVYALQHSVLSCNNLCLSKGLVGAGKPNVVRSLYTIVFLLVFVI